ncbi:MAG: hypothetical protein ACK5QC_08925 [Bacteroidota bacterium]
MSGEKILIIHPYDKTTIFLDSIKTNLDSSFKNDVFCFNVQLNDNSHKECLERIEKHPKNGLIIFLGHGKPSTLSGSKGDEYSPSISLEEIYKYPELYYFNENFINKENIKVFSGKKVFCLACNSKEKIADFAIENGVETYLGFGNIPSSKEEFKLAGVTNVSNEIVALMKSELTYIIMKSIEYSIFKSYTFEQLHNILQFIINQRISYILTSKKDFEERYILADYLYYLKKEVAIFGNKHNLLL